MDGVLSDFDRSFKTNTNMTPEEYEKTHSTKEFWSKIDSIKDFWFNLEWMPDGKMLWDFTKNYEPVIISTPGGDIESCKEQKKQWVKKNLGDGFSNPPPKSIFSFHKEKYAKKNDILIDDKPENIEKWENAGGIGILHVSAESSIEELKRVLGRRWSFNFLGIRNIDFFLRTSSSIQVNREIADILKDIASQQEDIWKGTAYTTAARNIESLDFPITDLEDFTSIEGIGSDINDEIHEYINTGTIGKLKDTSSEGMERGEASKTILPLLKEASNQGIQYTVCGSLRRKKERINDVDILILFSDIEKWKSLIDKVSDTVHRSGERDIDFIYKGMEINLRSIDQDEWGAGMLFFTGPDSFNVYMRKLAKERGWKLTRYGLFDNNGTRLAVTEDKIFDKLDMKYIKPEDR